MLRERAGNYTRLIKVQFQEVEEEEDLVVKLFIWKALFTLEKENLKVKNKYTLLPLNVKKKENNRLSVIKP